MTEAPNTPAHLTSFTMRGRALVETRTFEEMCVYLEARYAEIGMLCLGLETKDIDKTLWTLARRSVPLKVLKQRLSNSVAADLVFLLSSRFVRCLGVAASLSGHCVLNFLRIITQTARES